MGSFRNLKLSVELTILVGVFLGVFAAFAFVTYRTLETVRVTDPSTGTSPPPRT